MDTSRRFSADVKQEILCLVRRTEERTRGLGGWTTEGILFRLGLKKSRYHRWQKRDRDGTLADHATIREGDLTRALPEEKSAVIDYALAHPKDGYRRLAWQMVDEDVAFLSPSSVYRILNAADLLYRWKRSRHSGEAPPRPVGPNERWHTDIMYLRVGDSWYFLVSVIDAYSRYLVHSALLVSMAAPDVRLVIQEALERMWKDFPGAKPRIVSDNGSQFTSREFKQLVRQFELEHIRIKTYHPESNGLIERFHRSTREELGEVEITTLSRAREIIARWVEHYNNERLHAGIGYLTPADYYKGNPGKRQEERREKISLARRNRIMGNKNAFPPVVRNVFVDRPLCQDSCRMTGVMASVMISISLGVKGGFVGGSI